MVDIKDLHKKFGSQVVLNGLDLNIQEKGIIASSRTKRFRKNHAYKKHFRHGSARER